MPVGEDADGPEHAWDQTGVDLASCNGTLTAMSRTLDVYLHRDFAGNLIQDDDGRLIFKYAASWLEDSAARPLSRSLPLQKEKFTQKQCRGFFAGILPEQSQRELVARNLGISVQNDFAMLEQI